jgi:hypothetical protein
VWIIESPRLSATDDLELVLNPSGPFELDRQKPDIGPCDSPQFKIMGPDVDAMAQEDGVGFGPYGKCGDVVLDYGKGVLFEECRCGRFALPGIGQRRNRYEQLINRQRPVATHRAMLSAAPRAVLTIGSLNRTRSQEECTMADYQATPQPAADPGNTLGIVGLILAIIPCTSTIGLVLSIVAYIISRRANFHNGKALAGIIVGAAWLVLGLILQLTMGLISGIFQMT